MCIRDRCHGWSQTSSYRPGFKVTVVHPVLPGAMPLPVPGAHERDASPRLWDSSILPSVPVGLVPGPSAGRGGTTSAWTRAPLLETTNETRPAGTMGGVARKVAIIGA